MRRGLSLLLILTVVASAYAIERFPPPDFSGGHRLPTTSTPPPRGIAWEYVDLAMLVAALSAATWMALVRRSRRGVVVVMLASLAYLGFCRGGCVCPIGAIQNVALGLFNPQYAVPLVVLGFFLLPLVFTLLFGRTFCAGVCPLGALQDAVLIRPLKVPAWLEHSLGLLPWVILGAAVLVAATGGGFIICRQDPYVTIFRLSGTADMIIFSLAMLAVAMFIGRPYCRFGCPYGALLRPLSRLAWRHANITPAECINCRLCEDACPFGAIRRPSAQTLPRRSGRATLAAAIVLLPMLVAGGAALAGKLLAGPLASTHYTVQLSRQVYLEDTGKVKGPADNSAAFRAGGGKAADLHKAAADIQDQVARGAWIFGGFVGLVIGGKLISLCVRRRRDEYSVDRSKCLSCGRCFASCPVELARRGKVGAAARASSRTGEETP